MRPQIAGPELLEGFHEAKPYGAGEPSPRIRRGHEVQDARPRRTARSGRLLGRFRLRRRRLALAAGVESDRLPALRLELGPGGPLVLADGQRARQRRPERYARPGRRDLQRSRGRGGNAGGDARARGVAARPHRPPARRVHRRGQRQRRRRHSRAHARDGARFRGLPKYGRRENARRDRARRGSEDCSTKKPARCSA